MLSGLLGKLYLHLHERTYRSRLQKQQHFPEKYILSVGNLSAGGTGKTPVAAFLARHSPKKTMICLRGYGGSASTRGVLVSDGARLLSTAKEAGDEALLLGNLPGVVVVAGRDRAGLINRFGRDCDVVLLDDAFQNPSVGRNHELVLLDASVPFGEIKVFPQGRFREDLRALRRADTVLLTRTDQVEQAQLDTLLEGIAKHAPRAKTFLSRHTFAGISPRLETRDVGAFCGIGNPEAFFRTVETAGFRVVRRFTFRDHRAYSKRDLRKLEGDLPWVTTAKDAVRLPEAFLAESKIHVLDIELEIARGHDAFLSRVFAIDDTD